VLVIFQQRNKNSSYNSKLLQFIKIGSACLFDEDGSVAYDVLRQKAREIEQNRENNILVVSGAIALGMARENKQRSKEQLTAQELQGYAGTGQIYLMDLYKSLFTRNVAQLLVTEKELGQTESIRNLLLENAAKNRVTLVNYNDCVDFEELRKDNDTLAADIMLACEGDRLIILGNDYDGFRDCNGTLIERVQVIDDSLYSHCNGKSKQGNGGFKTKLDAAKKILENNKQMIVSNVNYSLDDIIHGRVRRTLFKQ
jgi:glutamate 5-kinase